MRQFFLMSITRVLFLFFFFFPIHFSFIQFLFFRSFSLISSFLFLPFLFLLFSFLSIFSKIVLLVCLYSLYFFFVMQNMPSLHLLEHGISFRQRVIITQPRSPLHFSWGERACQGGYHPPGRHPVREQAFPASRPREIDH